MTHNKTINLMSARMNAMMNAWRQCHTVVVVTGTVGQQT